MLILYLLKSTQIIDPSDRLKIWIFHKKPNIELLLKNFLLEIYLENEYFDHHAYPRLLQAHFQMRYLYSVIY